MSADSRTAGSLQRMERRMGWVIAWDAVWTRLYTRAICERGDKAWERVNRAERRYRRAERRWAAARSDGGGRLAEIERLEKEIAEMAP